MTPEKSIYLFHVSRAFGKREVISDFSATFPQGSRTCVMGPSGCGKTTLLHLILGLLHPDFGQVLLPPGWRATAVFQENRLLDSFHAVYNVQLACHKRVSSAWVESALMEVGISRESCFLPAGQLSGGMARRVAVVRALLPEGDLVIMDEPFKGLDPENKGKTVDFVLRHLEGRTLIAATHDKEDIRLLQAQCLNL